MLRKYIILSLLTLGMVLQTSPVPLRALELGPAGLAPMALPAGNIAIQPVVRADFNRDGSPESLLLTGGHLSILSRGRSVWQSPAAWTVIQAAITDLNHDGAPEATLLVWRLFRPWPVDQWLPYGGRIADFHDPAGYSCQIILIGWRGSEYGELWAGSPMAEPVRSFAVVGLSAGRHQELVTLEGRYSDARSAPGRAIKVWDWNGFGFTVVSTSQGTFDKMALVQARDGHNLILVP
jgi:hypothetical protein